MQKSYFQDNNYNSRDFTKETLQLGEYENCTFTNCIFTNTNLSDFSFEECNFKECNLSNAKILNTAFKSIHFENCKLVGLQFDQCNPFLLGFLFVDCQLNLASFYQLKLKGTFFKNCILHEVDFAETDLTGSNFDDCDFSGAMFGNTNLEQTDFRTSVNFSIDPEMNRIQKAKFSTENVAGLLDKYNIRIE